MPDEKHLPVEMDGGNQTELVTADVENEQIVDFVDRIEKSEKGSENISV